MTKIVKVILFLLFAVAMHCVANNIFTDNQVEGQECITSYTIESQKVSSAQLPYLPEGELTNGVQSHQTITYRIQRISILEYFISLKALAHKQSLREGALARHQGRIYDSTISYFCHPACEYYVFALRRILI